MGNLSDRFIKAEVLTPTPRGGIAGLTTTASIDGTIETKREDAEAADEATEGLAPKMRKVAS